MNSSLIIESQTYQIDAKEQLRESLLAVLKSRWYAHLLLVVFGSVALTLGYVQSQPAYAILGLTWITWVSVPFLQVSRLIKASRAIYGRNQQVQLSQHGFKLSDDIGNARIKPLCLLSKVQSKGKYLVFAFQDDVTMAVPLRAFSSVQLVEIQEFVESLSVSKQDRSSQS